MVMGHSKSIIVTHKLEMPEDVSYTAHPRAFIQI